MRRSTKLWLALMAASVPLTLTACQGSLQNGFTDTLSSDAAQDQSEPANPQADALLKLAADVEAQGKKDTALGLYERAAEVSGNASYVMVKLGDAYFRAGHKAQALKTYRAILAKPVLSNEILLAAGTSLVRAGDPAAGIPALQKAAKALNTAQAFERLGIAYTLSGQLKEARTALITAHEQASGDLDISTNLALVLSLTGEHKEAAELMEEVAGNDKAEPRHWRNFVLVLAIGGKADRAKKAAGNRVPDTELQELVKRAEVIRAANDPKARVKALGLAKS